MRIKHKVNVRIADDASMKDLLFGPDDELAEVISDSYQRQASGIFSIAAAGSESISFGDVDAVKGVFIKVDADVNVNINALGDILLARHTTTTGTYAKLFLEAGITSLVVGNPSAATARGLWCVWGDVVV